jgi:eukaryotic-like serine/threonine-protein kinase
MDSMAASTAERDMLFGLLALQNSLIDQDQLMSAVRAWSRDRVRPIADYLVGRGGFDSADRGAVEAMVERHLKKHGGSTEKSLGALTVGRSICETLGRVDDPQIEATLALVGSEVGPNGSADAERTAAYSSDEDRTVTYSLGTGTSDGQRFRVLRPHAQGGLGAVFVALDCELNREVALKKILEKHADDPVSRQRFLLEAEVTGGLEHPGIVPVYGLGTDSDGRPYYTMRFIKGDSLKEAIDRFHAGRADTSDPGRRSLELRKLLRQFLDACNAIDYAHSRGVLHRDIKPSNIIVGKHGETLVVDWGLAKALGRVDPGREADEQTLVPSSSSGSTETLPGSALGTPAYMSPEQACGDLERIGPGSDVYAMGATLYCLLSGRPPFEGKDIALLLRKVQRGEFARLRQLDPSIDKALEAICSKAMENKPEHRYETPRALADDIEHWLADEPASAYFERRHEQLGRWLRQHRAWTYAAVAALIAITLAATIGVVVLDRARRSEAVVRKEAETNFNMALNAVDDYLTSVSENTLFKLQDSVDIRGLRQELLNSALKYYKGFVNQRSHDPRLRRQLADAYFRVGEITTEVESPDTAIAAYREAQRICEPLIAAHPEDHELRGRLAESYLNVGKLKDIVTNLGLDAAMESLARARAILEPLAATNPLEARYQSSLADCYSEIAIIMARQQKPGEGLVLLENAEAIEKQLIDRYPDKHAYQKSLAEITNVLGYAYYKRGENDRAIKSFLEVQRTCRTLLAQVTVGPKPLWISNLLALSHHNIGSIHEAKGELTEAIESLEKSVDYRAALVDSHPSVLGYKVNLAMSCRQIAGIQHRAHEDAKALQSIQRSVEVLKALVKAQPDQAGYRSELGLSLNYLGCLYDGARKNSEALVTFEQAVAEQQLAVDKASENDEYRGFLANHLDNLGEQFVDLGHVAPGLALYRRALPFHREQSAAHSEARVFTLELLRALIRLGLTERHDGDSAAALKSFTDARKILELQTGTAPADDALRVLLGAMLDQEANALFDQGLIEEARQRLDRALLVLQTEPNRRTSDGASPPKLSSRRDVLYVMGTSESALGSGDVDRGWCSEALWDLARVLKAQKRLPEAETALRARAALWRDRPPDELIDLAFSQLDRALVIGFGNTSVSERARAIRELELEQADDNVLLAIARGFKDLRKLRSHPESEFLVSRADLEPLIMDLALPDQPFAGP